MSEPDASAAAVKLRRLCEDAKVADERRETENTEYADRHNAYAKLGGQYAAILTLTASHAQLVETVERLTRERDELQTAGRQWREGCAMHGSCRTAQIMHEMETGK